MEWWYVWHPHSLACSWFAAHVGGKIVKAQIVQMYKLQPLLQPRFLRRSMLMR
jgi:hypothetical protein